MSRRFSSGRCAALTLSLLLCPAGAFAQAGQPEAAPAAPAERAEQTPAAPPERAEQAPAAPPERAEQTPAAPPERAPAAPAGGAPSGDDGGSLRERVTRLEEGLKNAQRQLERVEAEQAKLKDELDGVWSSLWHYLAAAVGIIAGIGAFFWNKLVKAVQERGHEAVVSAVINRLFAEDAVRFTGLFEAHRKEITRAVMARDRTIALVGDHPDGARIKEILSSMGYTRFTSEATEAELVMLLGERACREQGIALVDQISRNGQMKWLVLYTGTERLAPDVMERLNRVVLAIPANVPATAASHMATLAVLTQSPK